MDVSHSQVSPGLAVTGVGGRYAFLDVAPGLYYVYFYVTPPGWATGGSCSYQGDYGWQWFGFSASFGGASVVSVGQGTETSGVNAVMSAGGTISGMVSGSSDRPLSGICVALSGPDGITSNSPFTSPEPYPVTTDGRFRITDLPAGRYYVRFLPGCGLVGYVAAWYQGTARSRQLVVVRAGRGIRLEPVRLTPAATPGVLAGEISSSPTGAPVPGACVVANVPGQPAHRARAGPSGRYWFALPAGTYELRVRPCETATRALASVIRKAVVITGRHSTTDNVRLPLGTQIRGTITGAGRDQPGMCARPIPVGGAALANEASGTPFGVAGPDGQYAVTGLAPGRYKILFTPDCSFGATGFAPQWFGAPHTGRPRVVTVRAGTSRDGVNADLAADGAISGLVVGAGRRSGSPVGGVCVTALPVAAGQDQLAVATTTSVNGSYLVDFLPPGTYIIRFTSGCGANGYATQWWRQAQSESRAAVVTVTAGATTAGIKARLLPA